MNRTNFAVGAAALAAVVCSTVPSFAQRPFLVKIRRVYQLEEKNGKCDLCHQIKPKEEPSEKNLNKFGQAIQADPAFKPLMGKGDKYEFSEKELAIVVKIVNSLDDKDSDGDGATNKEEMDLGYFPGDPKSTPTKKELADYRKKHPKAK